jgi:environmental stress-induced protein Ves
VVLNFLSKCIYRKIRKVDNVEFKLREESHHQKLLSLSYAPGWFSADTPISSTNKADRHNITEILLKVAFNTIN